MGNVLSTNQNLNNVYTSYGNWIGLCTGPPGPTSTPLNEAHGGSPAYARQSTVWTEGTNGSAVGSEVTLNLPPGTYPYMIFCQSSSGASMVDWCILPTPIMVTSQAAIGVTPSTATA